MSLVIVGGVLCAEADDVLNSTPLTGRPRARLTERTPTTLVTSWALKTSLRMELSSWNSGVCFQDFRGCFESLIHSHRILNVLGGAFVLSKTTHRMW